MFYCVGFVFVVVFLLVFVGRAHYQARSGGFFQHTGSRVIYWHRGGFSYAMYGFDLSSVEFLILTSALLPFFCTILTTLQRKREPNSSKEVVEGATILKIFTLTFTWRRLSPGEIQKLLPLMEEGKRRISIKLGEK